MTTSYNMTQTHSSTPVTMINPYDNNNINGLTVTAVPCLNSSNEKMQQLVIKNSTNTSFLQQNTCYYIKIKIPQNQNYDLNYGIRLMSLSSNDWSGADLMNSSNFQFVKYISIPKYNAMNIDTSTIWHYTFKDDRSIINAAIAKPISELPTGDGSATLRANKFYYNPDKSIINYYDNDGIIVTKQWPGTTASSNNFANKILVNELTIANSFENTQNDTVTREFLVMPKTIAYNAIYLYLKPIADDRNMRWDFTPNNTYMGRHIDLSAVKVWYGIVNTSAMPSASATVKSIGVWGRPQQLMCINGQEMQIGPSGYYELKNYDITSLYIANTATNDRYVADMQYQLN